MSVAVNVDIQIELVDQERKRDVLSSSSSSSTSSSSATTSEQQLSYNVFVTGDVDATDVVIKVVVFAPPHHATVDGFDSET